MRMNFDRFMLLLFGASLVVIGYGAIKGRGYYDWIRFNRFIDYGEYHSAYGVFVVIAGIVCMWIAFRDNKKR